MIMTKRKQNSNEGGLSAGAVEGIAWNSLGLVLSRIVGALTQFVVAFHLNSTEFGLAAIGTCQPHMDSLFRS